MAIQGGRIQKANKKSLNAKGKGKGKGKGKDISYIPKPYNPEPSSKEHPAKNDTCHHCKEVGHWKRNYPAYLAELIKKKKKVGIVSSSDVFIIELFSFPTKSWVYDTCCGTHSCITKQGLRGARKLKQGDLYLYVGNGVRAQVEAIGSFDLVLPNGLVFKNEVENQLGKTIKAIRSDRGGEYISQEFKDYLKACGIVQQLTSPYTPQRNGVFERRNRTLLDMVRSMMNLKTLPLSFWDYALESAARILNMVPTKKVDKTPYELWYGKVPNMNYDMEKYPKETMGYYFYFPPENKIVIARYAEFLEKNLLSQEVSGWAEELKEIQDKDTPPSENTSEIPMEVEGFKPPQEEVVLVRRSARTHRAPNRLFLNVEVEVHSLRDLNEPNNYKPAILDLESDKWVDAMSAEMQSMKDNQVLVLG
ncbi:retrotransposon protein, putative, ty1-copia subclass [Tanacetum coccineum]